MAEGINMGRKSPWTKGEYVELYQRVNDYAMFLYETLLEQEGEASAKEALAAYNILKYPVVYLFVHYHYGKFEDLHMLNMDTMAYITIYVANVKSFTQGILDSLRSQNVFCYDVNNDIAPLLGEMCKEVLYIENYF